MQTVLQSIRVSIPKAWRRDGGIRLNGIRPQKAAYFLAYAIELMLYAVRQGFLPVQATLFGLPGKTVVYIAHMLASLLVILLWSERFRPLLRVSVAVMAAGFLLFVFVPQGSGLHLLSGAIAMAGLGGAVTCARCGFAFAANNAERLFGMLLMTVCVSLIYLLETFGARGPLVTHILPLALTAALSFCLLRFREGDLEAKQTSGHEDAKSLYCALGFMIAYFGIDGYLYKLLYPSSVGGNVLFSVGMVLATAVFFTAFVVGRKNVWYLWTLFFAFAAAAAILAIFSPQIGSELPYHLAAGLAILGWPLSLYMLACAQRRFASYRLLKQCTLVFILLSPLTTVTDDLIKSYRPDLIPAVALAYILLLLLAFLLTIPYTYRHLFSVGWVDELSQNDMQKLREKAAEADRFAAYGLTPRQKEVAALLLAAKTRRQISGELGLSESTVKMHTSDLYRKLGINSRVELFRLFGTEKDGPPRE